MKRIAMLREQAFALRTLARNFQTVQASVEILAIQREIVDIAARCDALALDIEENQQAAGLNPPDSPPDIH